MSINDYAEPFAKVAEQVGPGVVQVKSGRGQGSGVLLDSRSVITNAHVVGNNPAPQITFADGVTRSGRVLATDRLYDLALVETEASREARVALAPEESIVPGKLVVAIGNPYGFGWTVTTGVVSSVDRMLGGLDGLIQTDAAINPGNSGGALVDLAGRLVGIPTLVLAHGQNIGFAIPSWQVDLVVDQFRRTGRAQHPWVGIAGATEVIDPVMSRALDLPERGVVVAGVEPSGPAARAGLQEFDMITGAEGVPTPSIQALRRAIRRTEVGATIRLEVLRSGRTYHRDIRVEEMPARVIEQ
ncbi:MAG TPA: trypsin-like peptidase domain-containing protein [Symbiobacteriaceae bacterium]|nr:trypsin-like peptidase domain-containing protein [Symbiobacteriaceae bacterium]